MARKPDKRVYVRRNRVRKKLQRRRVWAPIHSQKPNELQRQNLALIQEFTRLLKA